MRAIERPFLFTFVGAPRPSLLYSIRGNIVNQCIHSNHCRLLDCRENVCTMPEKVMEVFEHSVFCLQPPGDSYTRRSTFDAMLAGCIPVFFHPYSAYVQYEWHLPTNHSSYSVLIDERLILNNTIRIEEVLLKFTPEQIANMRKMVIHILPRIVYADPRLPSPLADVEDAFDITLQAVIERIAKLKRSTKDGNGDHSNANLDLQFRTQESMKGESAAEEATRMSMRKEGYLRDNDGIINAND